MNHRRSGGQALVEFALVIPLFLLILIGLFDLGRAVFAYTSITNAAREGARMAIVNQTTASIEARINQQAVGVGTTSCIRFLKAGKTSANCALTPAADLCPDPRAIGCVASIEVRTSYQALTPIIGSLIGPMVLTAKTELPIEFTCPNPAIAAWSTATSCPKQP